MRGRFVAAPEYLEILARDIGVDEDRLLSDMESDAVSEQLRATEAVARIFGFIGTPALVVGRTVVVGTVSEGVIAALVEQERRDGPPPVCSAWEPCTTPALKSTSRLTSTSNAPVRVQAWSAAQASPGPQWRGRERVA